ncbi:histone H2A [Tanacetum coccineum]
MEGAGKIKKGAAGRKAGGPRKKSVTRSVKAGLQFPGQQEVQNNPEALFVAIGYDEELGNQLLLEVTIATGGGVPNINHVLLPKKTAAKESTPKSPSKAAKSPKKA